MLHTGDIYETRARSARNEALRQLTRALSGYLFRSTSPRIVEAARTCPAPDNANVRLSKKNRAA